MECKVMYIDDEPDLELTEKLTELYSDNYVEYIFKSDDDYSKILEKVEEIKPNILLIDSRLFENSKVINNMKFSGEEFLLILKKYNPFIESAIITRNDVQDYESLKKYSASDYNSFDEYFEKVIEPFLKKSERNIFNYNLVLNKLEKTNAFNPMTIDRIKNSINGITDYDELKKSDIDELIEAFKALGE